MQYCNYDVYHELTRECDPDRYLSWAKEIASSIATYDPETAEEVEEWIDCTASFLRRYMKFASGCMSDAELYKFYNDILEMFDVGIAAREYQKQLAEDQLHEAEEMYYNELIDEGEFDTIKMEVEEIKEALDRDIKEIEEMKEFCMKAKDRFDVVACIEKVANAVHSRGSLLPVLCGAYLPEDVLEAYGLREIYEVRPEDAGYELSMSVPRVLDCIKEFRPSE